jgi:hypothetical protein
LVRGSVEEALRRPTMELVVVLNAEYREAVVVVVLRLLCILIRWR